MPPPPFHAARTPLESRTYQALVLSGASIRLHVIPAHTSEFLESLSFRGAETLCLLRFLRLQLD